MSSTHRTPRERFKVYVLTNLKQFKSDWEALAGEEPELEEWYLGGAGMAECLIDYFEDEEGLCEIETRRGRLEAR